MPRVETRYEHIILEDNVPFISGTQMKVIELVEQSRAWGWSPEELQTHHPFLRMGQIHSALAYYWDHKDELDPEIECRLQSSDRWRAEAETLESAPETDVETAWRQEVAARVAASAAGEVKTIPWEEIRGRFLARLSERRQS